MKLNFLPINLIWSNWTFFSNDCSCHVPEGGLAKITSKFPASSLQIFKKPPDLAKTQIRLHLWLHFYIIYTLVQQHLWVIITYSSLLFETNVLCKTNHHLLMVSSLLQLIASAVLNFDYIIIPFVLPRKLNLAQVKLWNLREDD